jgi:hypothetical protein
MLKKLAIVAALLYTGRFAVKLWLEMHTQVIVERFPDLPEKLVREAHAEMLKSAFTDPNFNLKTEEELDAHLRKLVNEKLQNV